MQLFRVSIYGDQVAEALAYTTQKMAVCALSSVVFQRRNTRIITVSGTEGHKMICMTLHE